MALIKSLEGVEETIRRCATRRLTYYRPNKKQAEFHAAGVQKRERLLLAGNQLGKTLSAGAEFAMHLTGEYPAWWRGRRFNRPVRAIAGSESIELTRKGIQRILFGPPESRAEWGTGMIPAEAIIGQPAMRGGVADAIASAAIRHVSGGESSVQLLSYDMGRTKWQSDTVDLVWLDEEPPDDIYSEALTRTNVTLGPVMFTATPLMGMTSVISRFYPRPDTPDRALIQMTISDVDHLTAQQKATIVASYQAHELEARTLGIPMLGSGRIFPVSEAAIKIPAFQIPPHWPQINGLDFGWDHPFAAVNLAHDREADVVYVCRAYRESQKTPPIHAAAVLPWGDWIPCAWPADGLQSGKDTGQALKISYETHGLNMLPEFAKDSTGSVSVEAGVTDLLTRMQTGRLRVFEHLNDWFEEFRQYHRKDGKIVKLADDLMSATRYANMMLRFAETKRPVLPKWQQARAKNRGATAWAS